MWLLFSEVALRRSDELEKRTMMTQIASHKTATREEWLAARLDLLEAEKELSGGATNWRAGFR